MKKNPNPYKFPRHIFLPGEVPHGTAVFLNGVKIDGVFFADTRRGIIDRYIYPIRLDKYKKRALSQRLRGIVMVVVPAE